ncbi:hypothetical protein [Pedobacter sp. L105]|uniref:hypothetical protein n=1 Tax=Pedobacter sp. L105 TaxID=1641871 RepID=UPI00131C61FB|nr:hypothetical protein [Pedobacter sp. L105]
MKLSSIILLVMLALFVTSLFASDLILKDRYNKIDKSDVYWNYEKILEKPFKHIKLTGGNLTNIVFEQNKNCSVRVADFWGGFKKSNIKASVDHDTLFIELPNNYTDLIEKSWMKSKVLVRIAAPELLSVEGFDTNFEIQKFQQKSLDINLSGKSRLEVESNNHTFDTLNIVQKDSSSVVFEMNPDIKESPDMQARLVNAKLQGVSALDIGHMKLNSSKLNIGDSAAVILSGKSIGKNK